MNKLVLIKDGLVVNCIVPPAVGDVGTFMTYINSQYDHVISVEASTYVGPGFTYDGTNFLPPIVADIVE